MSMTIEEWLPTVRGIDKMSRDKRDHEQFFIDPARPQFIEESSFFSPADGIIMYAKVIKDPKAELLDTKGASCTLQDLLQDKEYDKPSIVVSIFMTQWSPHLNRIPYAGLLCHKALEPMVTRNLPMLAAEEMLLKGIIDDSVPGFLKANGKNLNTIYVPQMNYKYHVLQIADSDIDCIVNFDSNQNVPYTQNQRFGMIRWGSTTDLVLPLDERFTFDIVCEPMTVVEAGIDILVHVEDKHVQR